MTKEIVCSGGEIILVDDEDYPVISRHKWHYTANGANTRSYAVTRLNMSDRGVRTIFMHSMIIGFALNVDHEDQNTKNNTKNNIRPASWQQNQWNKPKSKTTHGKPCTSKYKGVRYAPLKGIPRWLAMIKHVEEGKHKSTGTIIRIGYFWNEDDAASAYNKKVKELRGEWAWVNILPNQPNKSENEK